MDADSFDEYRFTIPAFSHEAGSQQPAETSGAKGLEILVIFTDLSGTLAALRTAEDLAQELEACVRLVVPYEVPYALPLTQPAVPVEFLEGQMRELASRINLRVAAQICLCRDKRRVLNLLLPPQSLVVVGGKRRWWPTAAQKLARSIQKDGHRLIFAESR